MEIRIVVSNERVGASRDKIALERGPLVYYVEEADSPSGVISL
ncbi:hypothetical protein V1I91_17815 [Maribacter cobaltidurans]|uniref:Non-reducing end beta-L-arabinofuranosidase-like GH127 C-terminal domain-containing protein n=1 Tax=Maribacter cobaltidurans TaxID=1178778 RepID=A0ABU7IYH0_9FLAO|nr:hypothetical protein [Maribacter cobaltidurans]MEE1977940.1 hypothetical protein [Maribacter cobaltidurans]